MILLVWLPYADADPTWDALLVTNECRYNKFYLLSKHSLDVRMQQQRLHSIMSSNLRVSTRRAQLRPASSRSKMCGQSIQP